MISEFIWAINLVFVLCFLGIALIFVDRSLIIVDRARDILRLAAIDVIEVVQRFNQAAIDAHQQRLALEWQERALEERAQLRHLITGGGNDDARHRNRK